VLIKQHWLFAPQLMITTREVRETEMRNTIPILFVLGIMTMIIPSAYATHSVSPNACYGDGHEAGQDGSFSQELYEFCEEYGDDFFLFVSSSLCTGLQLE
jgi:hypothetical protein